MAKRFSWRALRELALVSDRAPTGLAAPRFDPARVSVEDFRSWVARQPAGGEYCYIIPSKCAFAQYLTSKGARDARVNPFEYRDGVSSKECYPMPEGLDAALAAEPYTFGALADRLSQVEA